MSNLYYEPGPTASGRKVMLATTSYDSPDASYSFSIARSCQALAEAGIQSAYLLLQGNCHVDDARNSVVAEFLASDCTDLVFLDADVSWEPGHIVKLCTAETTDPETGKCTIVGGVYPYRREGHERGAMPVRTMAGKTAVENGMIEVEGLPTGFMRIPRPVIAAMTETSPSFTKDGKTIPILFERDIFEGGRRGGDIRFCMNWRDMGGRIFALADLRLGHCGKAVMRDSFAASSRRQTNSTLAHVADMIRAGTETEDTYREALTAVNNSWGAQVDVLSLAVLLARKADGPIIEMGSGLSTIMMAAANPDQTVFAVEHNRQFADQTKAMAQLAGVTNIALVTCELKDRWYDIEEDLKALPSKFALGLVDGPPRGEGDRMRFFERLGGSCTAILADDADNPAYREKLTKWADAVGRTIQTEQRAAVILKQGAV